MDIKTIRLFLDFGLVVLIWMVQLVVYPSFVHYPIKNLVVWHKQYTSHFSFIVIPLMLGQLGISLYQVFTEINSYSVSSILIIALLWGTTFSIFVPIHVAISKSNADQNSLRELVKKKLDTNRFMVSVVCYQLYLFLKKYIFNKIESYISIITYRFCLLQKK